MAAAGDQGTKAFWRAVRGYRRRADVSQEELARSLVVAQATLSRAEVNGRYMPSRDQVLQIAAILGLDSIEREELLALAGFANTSELVASLLLYMQRGEVDDQRREFTRGQMEVILQKCLAALQGARGPATTNSSRSN